MVSLNRRNVVGGAAALGVCVADEAQAFWFSKPLPGSWTTRRDLPFRVQEVYPTYFRRGGAGTFGEPLGPAILVNAGGIVGPETSVYRVTDRTTLYDPATDLWGEGPLLPEARHHLALCNHQGSLFGLGGFLSDGAGMWQMRANLWRLDPANGSIWQPRTSLPIPNAEGVTFSLGGVVHLIGGRTPSGSSNKNWEDHIDTDLHWAYDAAADRWHSLAPLPSPRNSMACAVVGETAYVIGGRTVRGGNTPANEVYVAWTDRWQKAAPMPKPKRGPHGQGGLAAAVWRKKIYVFGGEWWIDEGDGGVYDQVFEYDPRQDKWREVAAMPRPRHGLGAVALDDGIYLVGGASGPSGEGITAFLDRFSI
ncbi:MAG: galactose oxidase [Parvularculaceae bacterium]|nr:galactose oxidase [Parvularculaceae bacterium]